ncbi:penicillin-binding transpeptidase domain-containing protein [Allonocardiopsis opalescens]|nr:penicillin-binding transpeptidase domain-containing protein [Allonocardiopsis opalescens]
MRSRVRRIGAALAGLVIAAAGTACAAQASPEISVRNFLLDWQAGDYESAAAYTTGAPAEEVAGALRAHHGHLDIAAIRFGLGPISVADETASAAYRAEVDLGISDPVWEYEGQLTLNRIEGVWRVVWQPGVIHPQLGDGERLAVSHEIPERAQVLDRDGEPLVDNASVVALGVLPGELEDVTASVTQLAEATDHDADRLLNRVTSAPPNDFVPLVVFRRNDFTGELRSAVTGIPGVEERDIEMPLVPAHAGALIGAVSGTPSRQDEAEVGDRYQPGDTVGVSGLQEAFQVELAGTATTRVVTLDPEGNVAEVLAEWAGRASTPVHTTLDSEVLAAAETALANIPTDSHLVAVQAGTGDVLAVAEQPGGYRNDAALTGEFFAGDAFTMISTSALLEGGVVEPGAEVACEETSTVDGRTFANLSTGLAGYPVFEMTSQTPTFEQDFANSCTTAFASLSRSLEGQVLADTAARFGIGIDWSLPVDAYPGAFPELRSNADLAAASVGQDVTVSPIAMALAAGAVSDGTWWPPRLVTSPVQEERPPARPHEAARLEPLRELMRATVTDGLAQEANVGDDPVYAQTGLATQEIDGETRQVQWFVGYRGDIAFAIAVQTVPTVGAQQFAVTAAAQFLAALPSSVDGEQ